MSRRCHGDPFPLPCVFSDINYEDYRLGDFVPDEASFSDPRLAECIRGLNSMESAKIAREVPPTANSRPSTSQRSCLSRTMRALRRYAIDPNEGSDQSCLRDLFKPKDFYSLGDGHTRVPYSKKKLKLFTKSFPPPGQFAHASREKLCICWITPAIALKDPRQS